MFIYISIMMIMMIIVMTIMMKYDDDNYMEKSFVISS